jgi:hypothetical protein
MILAEGVVTGDYFLQVQLEKKKHKLAETAKQTAGKAE